MKKVLLLIGISISGNLIAQSSLNNIDFEDGDSSNWQLSIGEHCSTYLGCIQNETPGTDTNRHVVLSSGTDPDLPFISALCPWGSNYSFRLGDFNSPSLKKAERAYFSHTFQADDTLLNLNFAYVSTDPGHAPNYNPYMMIEVLDSSGTPIPSSVSYLNANDSTLEDTVLGVYRKYKDWTRFIVYDPSFVGKTYTFRFTNSDCGFGGHGGRLYIDFTKDVNALLVLNDSLGYRVQAPKGYETYQWSSGANDTLDYLMSPPNGMIYCTVTSANNITMTYSAFIMGTTVVDEHVEINNQFLLYPNPANNILNVKTQEEGSASIFDISGNLVKTLNYKGNSSFDISNLDNGNYIIRFFNNNGVVLESKSLKVVK